MSANALLKEVKSKHEEIISTIWNNFKNLNEDDWLQSLRRNAYTHVQECGLPTPKSERFKYTNLPVFLKDMHLSLSEATIQVKGNTNFSYELPDVIPSPANWLKDMLSAEPPGQNKYGDMSLWNLGNAFLRDGIVVDVPEGTHGQAPLEITIKGRDSSFFSPRILVQVGENSEFTIIEAHNGQGAYWNNQITQIHLKKNARLRHYRIIENPDISACTQNTHVQAEEGAYYETFTLTSATGLSRNQIHVELLGSGAECTLNGANMLSGAQHSDTTITIEHKAPHCISHQNYRNVLDDCSSGVFQGKVHVHQIAQKTDGYQLSNTLLLSDGAKMNTKPELEIYADDVKCSHGTTTGKLEDTPLFYLRSRGISEKEAKALLIQSFVSEVVEKIEDNHVQEIIRQKVLEWLKQ